jgi:hypothetical protein
MQYHRKWNQREGMAHPHFGTYPVCPFMVGDPNPVSQITGQSNNRIGSDAHRSGRFWMPDLTAFFSAAYIGKKQSFH